MKTLSRFGLLLSFAAACGASATPPRMSSHTPSENAGGRGKQDQSRPSRGRIEGTIERSPNERKRMRIFGKIQRILKKDHGQLPKLQTVFRGGIGDPVVNITNETSFKLTIWFAGPCAHKTIVLAMKKKTEVFCPGTYNIAAVVDNNEYLPLVRENQKFDSGIGYQLKIIIKHHPQKKP